MNRKDFLKGSVATAASLALTAGISCTDTSDGQSNSVRPGGAVRKDGKLLNAYYFRAHMYTMVPSQVREDLQRMADVGTNVVSIAVLEQDLYAAVENIEIICNEAAKLGMEVWAVPSRWGGLLAGAPKVPSMFTILNQDTWTIDEDGSYVSSRWSGRISSIFHPKTYEFMLETSLKVYETWDIKGIIWDEPKSLNKDFHPLAIEKLGTNATIMDHIWENVDFYSRLNQELKAKHPDKATAMFTYAHMDDELIYALAQIRGLDIFGCDGRAWGASDEGAVEGRTLNKTLLDNNGQRFIDAAKKNDKKSLWLIENHNLVDNDIPLLAKGMPEVVKSDVDHLIYYYYPRSLSKPDEIMKIVHENVRNF